MSLSLEVQDPRPRVGTERSSLTGSFRSRAAAGRMISGASTGTAGADVLFASSTEGITWAQACLSLMTCIIGAGIMALPQLPVRGGWAVSTIIMCLCCAAIGMAGVEGIWQTFMAYNQDKADSAQLMSYEDLGRVAIGRPGELLVFVTVAVYFIGVLAGYTILVAQQLEAMTKMFNIVISQQIWTCMLFLPFLGLAFLRNMTAIAKVVPIGIVGAFCSCGLICVMAVYSSSTWKDWTQEDLHEKQIHQMWPESAMSLGVVIGTLFGAFGVNANVPSVLCEMRNPAEFPSAFRTALVGVLALYLGIMLLGHYGYGNYVQSNILISMSRSPANATEAFASFEGGALKWCYWTGPCGWIASFIMQVCVLANLVISFPLNLMAVIQSFQTMNGIGDKLPVGSFQNYMMRTCLVVLIFAIALGVPDFGVVFAFFASLCGPLLQVIYPICFGAKVQSLASNSRMRLSPLNLAILLLAFICVLIGVADSATSLVASLKPSPACGEAMGHCSNDGTRYYLD